MPRILGQRFVHRSSDKEPSVEYELELDFKDRAIMDNRLEIDVIAKRRPADGQEWTRVSATVRYDLPGTSITVLVEGKEVGHIDMGKYLDVVRLPVENAFDEVGRTIEDAIGFIPAVDPVIGCLLKGGISAVVGQSIRCYKASGEKERIRAMLRCLAEHAPQMLWVATGRALRCAIFLGLG